MTVALPNDRGAGGIHRPEGLPEPVRLLLHTIEWRTRFAMQVVRRAVGLAEQRQFGVQSLSDGLTFVLPGIESESVFTYGICDGLLAGGLRSAIRVFNWGLPFPGGFLGNLTRLDRNRRRGVDLAKQIMAYQDEYPGRPVRIIGHSGGCGVAVFAAEALPAERSVHSLVLLSGALSPMYDLSRALARVRRGILATYSHKDHLVLGWGTRLFGTTDRRFCPASGCVGFQVPRDGEADGELYRKLTQIQWHPGMIKECSHWGGHITSACEEFLVSHISPWLNGE